MKKTIPTLLSLSLAISPFGGLAFAEMETSKPSVSVDVIPSTVSVESIPSSSSKVEATPPTTDTNEITVSPKDNDWLTRPKNNRDWTFALDAQYQTQDLKSNVDSSQTKEKAERFLIHGRRRFKVDDSNLSLDLSLGYQQSNFNYRGGQAELDLDGYTYGLELSYQPRQCKELIVDIGVAQSHLEGRDFVDHLTGTTGLTLDAKLNEFRYYFVPSYELCRFNSAHSQHAFRAHLGFEERKWEMNMGWYTNAKEDMKIDQPWLAGLSYDLQPFVSSCPFAYRLNLRADILDNGYRAKLNCGFSF